MALRQPEVRPPSPPRAEDLPYEDGEPMDTPRHRKQMELLLQSLELAWKDRTDFYAGGNMFFYYSETQSKRNDFRGPDVFIVLDTDRRGRLSWVVWEEDGRCPDVIIELTSPSTWDVDHGEKMGVYARLAIPEYFIFDPYAGTLEGWALDLADRAWRPLAPDVRGWMRSHKLGLWLGVEAAALRGEEHGPWLRWFDDAGARLPSPEEALAAAEAHAAAEAERARTLEAARAEEAERVRVLEAKLAAYEQGMKKP